jgi:hypothetical protein
VVGQVLVLQYGKILFNSRKLTGALQIPGLHGSLPLAVLEVFDEGFPKLIGIWDLCA